MNLELSFVRSRVATSDLYPSMEVLAWPAQRPTVMHRLGSCGREVESLVSLTGPAVGSLNGIDNRVGPVNLDGTMKIDGDRASPNIIAPGRREAHFGDPSISSRVANLRHREHQTRAYHSQCHKNPSAAQRHSGIPPWLDLFFSLVTSGPPDYPRRAGLLMEKGAALSTSPSCGQAPQRCRPVFLKGKTSAGGIILLTSPFFKRLSVRHMRGDSL